MSRKFKLALATLGLVVASIPAFAIYASGKPTLSKYLAAQTTPTCKDADFIKEVDKDLNDLGPIFKTVTTSPDSAANVIIQVAITRQKYEDLTAPEGCFGVQVQTVVTLANFGDLAAVIIASQVDKKTDPKVYSDTYQSQLKRFQTQLAQLNKFVFGDTATPEATPAS